MRLLAPAKINLDLRVGPPRADGFHPVLTWMVTVGLFDTLEVERSDDGRVALRCDRPDLPCDPSNLVVRAAEALRGRLGRGCPPRSADQDPALARLPRDGGSGSSAPSGPDQREASGTAGSGSRVGADDAGAARRDRPVPRPREAGVAASIGGGDASTCGTALGAGRGAHAHLGARIVLTKRIPLGAGLGGGSSDTAATLAALDAAWDLGCPAAELAALAATLGSDVPFFLAGPSAVCRGRGERVEPLPPPLPRLALLLLPDRPMPTGPVYRKFDDMGLGKEGWPEDDDQPDYRAWARLDSARLLPRLANNLEIAAFAIAPELGQLRDQAERALGRIVRMSGSGSSLFSLFDAVEADAADEAARRLAQDLRVTTQVVEVAPRLPLAMTTRGRPARYM